MKVLFVHNTITHYRIPFFNKLANEIDCKFIFTNLELGKKIYGLSSDNLKINFSYDYIKKKNFIQMINILKKENFDLAVLPPIDTGYDAIIAFIIKLYCKIKSKKIAYFTEKWQCEKKYMPWGKYLKNTLQKMVIKFIIKNINVYICSGTKSKEYLINHIKVNKNKICIAPDVSNVNEDFTEENIDIRKIYNIKKNNKIVLYYGRIIERKGLGILLNAFNEITKIKDDVTLLICGNGEDLDKFKEIVIRDNIKNIIFTGKIEPEFSSYYFKQSDVFVLPSFFHKGTVEAWGLTTNESMQVGTPVVSTNAVGAAYDLIIDGITGYMVQQGSVSDLYDGIIKIISKNNNGDISNNCENLIKTRYQYSNMVKAFIYAFSEA